MTEPTKPSRRAADRARDYALLSDLMSPEADLIALATKHFKKRDPLNAFIRWFTPQRRQLLRNLMAIDDLRTGLTLSRARQPAAAALLRLTAAENPETARKASADLLKSAPKRAQPRKPAQSRSKIPARSDADQQDMDSILDRMKPAKQPPPPPPAGEVPESIPGARAEGAQGARTEVTASPTRRHHDPHRTSHGGVG